MSQMPATAVATDSPANNTATTTTTTPSLPTSSNKETSAKANSTDNSVPASSESHAKPDQYPHHVIFVVHGMGRQLEEFGNYERNVGYLVENIKTVLQSQFHELKTDVHIIPIEWHAKLHSMVDERMALASLRTVPKVRLVMNDYFADILYYFNNHFGSEIIQMIVDELNEAYSTFIAKHPDFNGKIAVYALSLGGVAMFDILTCMDDDEPELEEEQTVESVKDPDLEGTTSTQGESETSSQSEPAKKKPRFRKQDQPKFRAVIPKLKFRPDLFFTVGSPVGAVMVMRNLEWETFHPPDDIIHHNIFHPFDPLAYRIEPLIDPIFAAIPAVTLTSTGNSQLFPISLPSLASLPSIPGSISSFWENKVPAIPIPKPSIPSIPTLSTLSQMTQSLKAGRWLPGGGGGSGRTTDGSISNESGGESASEDQLNNTKGHQHGSEESDMETSDTNPDESRRKSRLSQTANTNPSLTEAIAAAAVATYLDQRESGSSGTTATEPMLGSGINTTTTTTTSKSAPPSPSKRPSLGPRRISSRIEDDQENASSADPADRVTEPEEEEPMRPSTKADQDLSGVSLMEFERVMGVEEGPSTMEKEQGVGAKSDVVLEDVVRSVPTSPILDRHDQHAHGQDSINSNEGIEGMQARHVDHEKVKHNTESEKNRRVTIASEEEESGNTNNGKQDPTKGKDDKENSHRPRILVGARETKVPYRIDHVLQETTVDQYTNEYLLGMRSHFRYWGNRDIAYHILKSILQPGDTTEDGVLNLQPEMPPPVTAPKSIKEAAEAKAKAAGAAYHQTQEQQGHKKSLSFTLSNYRNQDNNKEDNNNSNNRSRNSGQYGRYGYGDDGQLSGYRYADLDMSSAANVASSSNTLYQNSPFVKKPWEQSGRTDRAQSYHPAGESRATAGSATSPERVNVSASGSERRATSPSRGFEEGIVVPDLARPPKSHYRSSRVEERQNRLD
ncbi:hypothetical protein BGZ80_003530 [Entomortierella chlamydospora]|uniref:DDHD domain-containing protein n=1 Tax=Entomortierella chlamydospora TaxID=101097 RepID=A0A9P6MP54_9FUNG|nr:hypothetical protein BGZ79_008031 [Entomortierella chlamydospora]KAG0008368.1 hypothetical protein BGZ80_003530 [Entomortierella chlamydospora]